MDYFTPIVDDPYTFGQIAVTNALSDIYAMGGEPLTALNIIGFPATLPLSILTDILRGGYDKLTEAKVTLVGGHSIKDKEPKYGVAVTGIIDEDKIITNSNAKPKDTLVLTKPIGTGIISTALKSDKVDPHLLEESVNSMLKLNEKASRIMVEVGVNACTDITGFGVLGHLYELVNASKVGARIFSQEVPKFVGAKPRDGRGSGGDGVYEYIEQGMVPPGTYTNMEFIKPYVRFSSVVKKNDRILLSDAQTSGGLLISVSTEKEAELLRRLRESGEGAWVIGEIISEHIGRIEVN